MDRLSQGRRSPGWARCRSIARGRVRRAEWSLDDANRTVRPLDAWASSLGHLEDTLKAAPAVSSAAPAAVVRPAKKGPRGEGDVPPGSGVAKAVPAKQGATAIARTCGRQGTAAKPAARAKATPLTAKAPPAKVSRVSKTAAAQTLPAKVTPDKTTPPRAAPTAKVTPAKATPARVARCRAGKAAPVGAAKSPAAKAAHRPPVKASKAKILPPSQSGQRPPGRAERLDRGSSTGRLVRYRCSTVTLAGVVLAVFAGGLSGCSVTHGARPMPAPSPGRDR